ncbi:MAG: methylenetetrahydrofolate reductase [NAD(P)H] [Chloroflexota bacterium]
MRIADLFGRGRPVFSFELFPPKTEEGVRSLYATVEHELAPLEPSFVSVTYGAGGSTRDLTVDLVSRIKRELGLEAMAHLTCVGHNAAELAEVLDRLEANGIENVLALRGDPPHGEEGFVRPEGGFAYAQELARFIRARYPFCLGGASYPEGHVGAASREADLWHLKEKVDSGVDFLITQLFFDAADYFRFVSQARSLGIGVPIVPGILPITNLGQMERFAGLCGAHIPAALRARLAATPGDEAAVTAVGIDWATEQCQRLLDGGAPGIHFYTINRSLSTRAVMERLNSSMAIPA